MNEVSENSFLLKRFFCLNDRFTSVRIDLFQKNSRVDLHLSGYLLNVLRKFDSRGAMEFELIVAWSLEQSLIWFIFRLDSLDIVGAEHQQQPQENHE
jgi:hypothetical protein